MNAVADQVETIPVAFTVLGIDRTPAAGRLVALANVELDVCGIVLTLQGVRIVRAPGGGLACEAPTWRHPTRGDHLPALVLPPALRDALAAEVFEQAREAGL